MDPNLVRNQHEPSVWQTFFRPHLSVSVTQHLAGKRGLSTLHHERPESEHMPRPRVSLLRLDSQGEDNRSPPIPSFEGSTFHRSEVSFYHKEKPVDNRYMMSPSSALPPPTSQRPQNILPERTSKLISVMEEVEQVNMMRFAQFSSSVPNGNQMQQREGFFPASVPLTRGLPYFRPMIPVVGLSASAILFARFKQAERYIDRTNTCLFMQANKPSENTKRKSEIYSSFLLAKLELATLMNDKQKLTMNQHLPQSKQVARPAVEDNNSVLEKKSVSEIDIKAVKMNQKSLESSKQDVEENIAPLSTVSVKQDDKSDECQNQKESDISETIVTASVSCDLLTHDNQTEDGSSCFSSECSYQNDENDDGGDISEDEIDEEEYNERDSDTSGSLSDFESDTESYDASSEYESGSDLESDAESWSSDVKDQVPLCNNAIVSFIIGQGNEAAGGKDSGFDEGDEPPLNNDAENQDQVDEDHLWHSFMASGDPYNPINGWKCCSASQFRRSTPMNQIGLGTNEVVNNSDHVLPKLKYDVIKPHCLISEDDSISKEEIKMNRHSNSSCETKDAPEEPNDVVTPGVDKASCSVIECLLKSCATTSSKRTNNQNNTVNEINCDDDAAIDTDVVENIPKSCLKNKLSGQEKQTKKVSFSDKDVSSIAYENPAWCDDYRKIREPYWECFARDRCRFRRRMKEVSDAISYCFDPNHRQRMLTKLKINY